MKFRTKGKNAKSNDNDLPNVELPATLVDAEIDELGPGISFDGTFCRMLARSPQLALIFDRS